MNFDVKRILELTNKSNLIKYGGNSKIHKVKFKSRYFCVKDYSHRSDSNYRMKKEFYSLTKLSVHKSSIFALPFGYSEKSSKAAYEWLNGTTPKMDSECINYMFLVIKKLNSIAKSSQQSDFGKATDFIFKKIDIAEQLQQRFSRISLSTLKIPKNIFGDLESALNFVSSKCELRGEPIITLSVSDLGSHNLLWDKQLSELHCVDLEFFGWDDAHKLCIDTLLHPKNEWNLELGLQFISKFKLIHQVDVNRLLDFWNLLNLKWGLIVLSKYLREQDYQIQSNEKIGTLELAHRYILRSVKKISTIEDIIEQSSIKQ
jgi:hypothetical protein